MMNKPFLVSGFISIHIADEGRSREDILLAQKEELTEYINTLAGYMPHEDFETIRCEKDIYIEPFTFWTSVVTVVTFWSERDLGSITAPKSFRIRAGAIRRFMATNFSNGKPTFTMTVEYKRILFNWLKQAFIDPLFGYNVNMLERYEINLESAASGYLSTGDFVGSVAKHFQATRSSMQCRKS